MSINWISLFYHRYHQNLPLKYQYLTSHNPNQIMPGGTTNKSTPIHLFQPRVGTPNTYSEKFIFRVGLSWVKYW